MVKISKGFIECRSSHEIRMKKIALVKNSHFRHHLQKRAASTVMESFWMLCFVFAREKIVSLNFVTYVSRCPPVVLNRCLFVGHQNCLILYKIRISDTNFINIMKSHISAVKSSRNSKSSDSKMFTLVLGGPPFFLRWEPLVSTSVFQRRKPGGPPF